MNRSERVELQRRVEDLHRQHPEWQAREIEAQLEALLPVAYGSWAEDTPIEDSRLRAIQRWRGANRWTTGAAVSRTEFPYVWPYGERQRQEVDSAYTPSRVPVLGSWRLFLYNCSPEVVRDVKIRLDGEPAGYSPAILAGKFCEIQWQRIDAIRSITLSGGAAGPSQHTLLAEFVVARGTKEVHFQGSLWLDPVQGWRVFQGNEDRSTELA